MSIPEGRVRGTSKRSAARAAAHKSRRRRQRVWMQAPTTQHEEGQAKEAASPSPTQRAPRPAAEINSSPLPAHTPSPSPSPSLSGSIGALGLSVDSVTLSGPISYGLPVYDVHRKACDPPPQHAPPPPPPSCVCVFVSGVVCPWYGGCECRAFRGGGGALLAEATLRRRGSGTHAWWLQGRVIFSLRELEKGETWYTENRNCVRRISDTHVLLGGTHHTAPTAPSTLPPPRHTHDTHNTQRTPHTRTPLPQHLELPRADRNCVACVPACVRVRRDHRVGHPRGGGL